VLSVSPFGVVHAQLLPPSSLALQLLALVKEGVRDFSISRAAVSWGIPVPRDPEQTVYVWFDALIGKCRRYRRCASVLQGFVVCIVCQASRVSPYLLSNWESSPSWHAISTICFSCSMDFRPCHAANCITAIESVCMTLRCLRTSVVLVVYGARGTVVHWTQFTIAGRLNDFDLLSGVFTVVGKLFTTPWYNV
jgi:hypothetical protein